MRLVPLLLLLVACGPDADDAFTRGPTVDDDDDDDAEGPEILETAGSVGVFYWEKPDDQGDLQAGAQFSASFWNVLQQGEAGTGGVDIAAPQGVDECEITLWTPADAEVVGGVAELRQQLLAGPLSLTSPTWTVDLSPNANDGPTTYYFELNPDYAIHFEAPYAVEASGGQFPAFELTDVLALPAALTLTAPTTDTYFTLDGAGFDLSWTGGREERLWIELGNESPTDEQLVQINCDVLNDGSFTVPAELMAQVPTGYELRLTLDQPVSDSFEVDGRSVGVGATSSAQALGAR